MAVKVIDFFGLPSRKPVLTMVDGRLVPLDLVIAPEDCPYVIIKTSNRSRDEDKYQDREDDFLYTAVSYRIPDSAIATLLDRSIASVQRRLKELGISRVGE